MKKNLVILFLTLVSFNSYSQTNEEIEHLLNEILLVEGNYDDLIESKQANLLVSYGKDILPKLVFFFTSTEISKLKLNCFKSNLTKGEIAIIIAEKIESIPKFEIKLPYGDYLFGRCKGNPNWIDDNLPRIRIGGVEQFIQKYNEWLNSSKRKRIYNIEN